MGIVPVFLEVVGSQRFYSWGHTHNDIEVFDSKGKHLGSMDPITGKVYKDLLKLEPCPKAQHKKYRTLVRQSLIIEVIHSRWFYFNFFMKSFRRGRFTAIPTIASNAFPFGQRFTTINAFIWIKLIHIPFLLLHFSKREIVNVCCS
ncbi:hypothetical protein H7K21_19040 [Cytobacillus firmus]|nr:hypothetical protein [Cytobacillus firmus]